MTDNKINDELSQKIVYTGIHKNIGFEITHWGKPYMCDGRGMWNYYIYVTSTMLSEEDFKLFWLTPRDFYDLTRGKKRPLYDYGVLDDLEFHGGITFYEKGTTIDIEPEIKYVKIGCDYGHLWDYERGYEYNEKSVLFDVKNTIDLMTSRIKFKRPCCYSGEWVYEEDGIFHEDRFYSKDGFDSMQQYKSQRGE